jgi:hypothetical protein
MVLRVLVLALFAAGLSSFGYRTARRSIAHFRGGHPNDGIRSAFVAAIVTSNAIVAAVIALLIGLQKI